MKNILELLKLAKLKDKTGNYKEADLFDIKIIKLAQELPMDESIPEIPEDRVFVIPDENIYKVEQLIEKLNRRAKKLGQPAIVIENVGKEQKKVVDDSGFDRIQNYTKIKIHGQAPKINGWTFVGTIAHHPSGHNIIKSVPGYEIPAYFRERGTICEHCNTSRRRNDTMILRDDNGNYKQIGRQCIKDFLGHEDPHNMASYAEYMQDMYQSADEYENEDRGSGGRNTGELPYDLQSFLTIAAAWVRQNGYISKAKSSEYHPATSSLVHSILNPYSRQEINERDEFFKTITPADEAVSEEAIDWVRSMGADENYMQNLSDYMYNIVTAVQTNTVDKYTFGLLLSLIPAYFKHKEGELRKSKEKEDATNGTPTNPYIGEVGKRVPLTLTVLGVRSYDTQYGTIFVNMMKDSEGRYVTWKGNQNLEQGQTYSMQAMVKSQEEDKYNHGLPTTYIQRPTKITEI
jgi:hypothetical protein